jgi:hypothetical protein
MPADNKLELIVTVDTDTLLSKLAEKPASAD